LAVTSRAAGGRAAIIIVLSACGLTAGAPFAVARAPEPPLSIELKLLSGDAARGRYRVEVRLRADVVLDEPVMTVRLLSREEVQASRAGRSPRRESREAVVVTRGRELVREIEVLTDAHEPVLLLVGLGGRADGLRLQRTRGLDLGPAPEEPAATLRTDQLGREYYEVRMPEPPR
jgi:hypothetical protein